MWLGLHRPLLSANDRVFNPILPRRSSSEDPSCPTNHFAIRVTRNEKRKFDAQTRQARSSSPIFVRPFARDALFALRKLSRERATSICSALLNFYFALLFLSPICPLFLLLVFSFLFFSFLFFSFFFFESFRWILLERKHEEAENIEQSARQHGEFHFRYLISPFSSADPMFSQCIPAFLRMFLPSSSRLHPRRSRVYIRNISVVSLILFTRIFLRPVSTVSIYLGNNFLFPSVQTLFHP